MSSGAVATFADVVIKNTQEQASDGSSGRGINIQEGAALTFTRGLVSSNRDVGVALFDEETSGTFEDVAIVDTQGQASDGSDGRGLSIQAGATMSFNRGLVSRNRYTGCLLLTRVPLQPSKMW